MRPRSLHIENFTCYTAPAEIDFDGMDVFVICGPTGAGKTTIVDAICYALYGRIPRDPARRNTALVARGRDRMRVALEFEAAGERYRVSRGINQRRKTAKSGGEQVSRDVSPVQFEHRDSDAWTPVADRVEAIEQEIERIVGLDFEGFTRCVLLPQGQFAEFLSGEPKERRKIFMDLLDLHIYGRIMQIANRRHEDLRKDVENIETRLREDFADATEEALERARAEIAEVTPLLKRAKDERDALQQAAAFAQQVVDARKRERDRRAEHDTQIKKIDETERAAATDEQKLAELQGRLAASQRDLAEIKYVAALHHALGLALEKARHVEQREQELARAQSAASERAGVTTAARERDKADARDAAAKEALRAAELTLEDARRQDAAAHVRSGLKPGDTCPVCGEKIRKLPKGTGPDVKAAERSLETARKGADRAATGAVEAREAFAREEQKLRAAEEQAQAAERALDQARAELAEALPPGVEPAPGPIEARFKQQDAASRIFERLTRDVNTLRDEIETQRKAMAERTATIQRLHGGAENLLREAAAARDEGNEAKTRLIELAQKCAWTDVIREIEAKRDPSPLLKPKREQSASDLEALTRRLATLEADQKRIAQAIGRAADLRERRGALKEEAERYRELGVLLRGNNFLDFVIEEAMRVLAESATQHLRTLHDRFAITVKGVEFLVVDHWQADNERPARTLSGGETFVASLALALALSERLPELQSKAAATLESLFLDEGFGTLDGETLNTVIEALEALRSEDRMVGIITHVPELARRIECRIEVAKSPAGSTLTVVGA